MNIWWLHSLFFSFSPDKEGSAEPDLADTHDMHKQMRYLCWSGLIIQILNKWNVKK